jgi:hypothetical protein
MLNSVAKWLTLALDGWMVTARPRPLYPRERPGTHYIGGWVGPGPVWTGAENLAPPPGFDPRTVANRCTDCAIPLPAYSYLAL